jgi:hypothetical protein
MIGKKKTTLRFHLILVRIATMKKSRMAGMAKWVERLPSKHEALSSNPSIQKTQQKQTNKKENKNKKMDVTIWKKMNAYTLLWECKSV